MALQKKSLSNISKLPKAILLTARFLENTSPKLAARFAMNIFTTPQKFKLPRREEEMDADSIQEMILIPGINKNINVYRSGTGSEKILLVHGWSGRGTQMYSIRAALLKNGYTVISFDAPAHGKSEGKRTEMAQFINCILYIEKSYGPFTYSIGHSLGAMSVLNAMVIGFAIKRAVIVGSGDIIKDIMYDFVKKLGMGIATANIMIKMFEKKYGQTINNFSAYIAAKQIEVPVLIIHDEDDTDVDVKAAYNISRQMETSKLMITQGLGHRKILGDSKVIKEIVQFLK